MYSAGEHGSHVELVELIIGDGNVSTILETPTGIQIKDVDMTFCAATWEQWESWIRGKADDCLRALDAPLQVADLPLCLSASMPLCFYASCSMLLSLDASLDAALDAALSLSLDRYCFHCDSCLHSHSYSHYHFALYLLL